MKNKNPFPTFQQLLTSENNVVAYGGNLSSDVLLCAYQRGIFPWFNDDKYIMWWSPDPRMVLFPNEFKLSHSLKKKIKAKNYEIRVNSAFSQVISECANKKRRGQDGTWITQGIQKGYIDLHQKGFAYSIETWIDNQLAGGLYGVLMGKVFCGESMFQHVTDASKLAFAYLIQEFVPKHQINLIDCQMHTPHLESLGGREISRKEFLTIFQSSNQ